MYYEPLGKQCNLFWLHMRTNRQVCTSGMKSDITILLWNCSLFVNYRVLTLEIKAGNRITWPNLLPCRYDNHLTATSITFLAVYLCSVFVCFILSEWNKMKSRRCVQDKLDYCVIDIGVEQQQRVSHLFAGQHFITKRNNISLCHEIASFKYLTALLF